MTSETTPDTIVVTGGGTGMGRDVALDQVALGREVVVVGRRAEALQETRGLAADPARVVPVAADVTTHDGVAALVRALDGRAVTGFVAAAGGQGDFIDPGGSPAEVDAAWTEALRKNLFSAVLPVEAVLPSMVDGVGRIVLVGSTSALDGLGGPYATAKAAMAGYGRDLARRAGTRGITANTIAPGFVGDTDFFEAGGFGDSEPMVEGAAARTLVGRVGLPQDVTASVRWLLGQNAGWVTGQTIAVDGGSVMVR